MVIVVIVFVVICAFIYIKNVDDTEEDVALIVDNDSNQLLTDGIQGMLILIIDDEVKIFDYDGSKVNIDYIKPGMRVNFKYNSDIIEGYPGIVNKVFEIKILD
ncbi:hypothetical protein [Clostridium sp. B9]|uniref:hypothetical protein n=1 Tax=Clostridium sp. B9 TaxID=3423224 RepID=UPI003D2EA836